MFRFPWFSPFLGGTVDALNTQAGMDINVIRKSYGDQPLSMGVESTPTSFDSLVPEGPAAHVFLGQTPARRAPEEKPNTNAVSYPGSFGLKDANWRCSFPHNYASLTGSVPVEKSEIPLSLEAVKWRLKAPHRKSDMLRHVVAENSFGFKWCC